MRGVLNSPWRGKRDSAALTLLLSLCGPIRPMSEETDRELKESSFELHVNTRARDPRVSCGVLLSVLLTDKVFYDQHI